MPRFNPDTSARSCHPAAARRRPARRMALAAGVLAAALPRLAAAVAVDAGDYAYVPPGTDLALLYYQHSQGSALYAGGHKTSAHADLRADVGIARGVRYLDVGGYTVAPQFLLPFGTVHTGGDLDGLGVSNGVGDLILATTVHLLKDDPGRRAFGITPWLWLPTGHYDRQRALNPFGENRWKFALQAGGVLPLGDKFTLDLIGDMQWFGDNTKAGPGGATLSQRPAWEVQTHLRYHLSAATSINLMASRYVGGETEIDGVRQHDRQRRTRASLGMAHFFAPGWQVLGTVGRDLAVDTGVREDARLNLRLMKVF